MYQWHLKSFASEINAGKIESLSKIIVHVKIGVRSLTLVFPTKYMYDKTYTQWIPTQNIDKVQN